MTIRSVLDNAIIYECFNTLIGENRCRAALVNNYIRPKQTDRILDVGCGPGNMLPFLPKCGYLGVDPNESYIAAARRRYGDRGDFVVGRIGHLNIDQFGTFDIVIAIGVVHHLDNSEALDLFRLAFKSVGAGARLITMDGCRTENQSAITRYLLSQDRGQFVRNQEQYLELARSSFQLVIPELRKDLLRIPYTHLIMECIR